MSRKAVHEPDSPILDSVREAAEGRAAMLAWMPPSPFNPYPEMLYRGLDQKGIGQLSIRPYDVAEVLEASNTAAVPVVFHQHWTGWVLGGEADRAKAEARLQRAETLLDSIQAVPLVWTVHNVMPHECPFPDLEVKLRNRLAAQASVIHIMNPLSIRVVSDHYRLPPDKVVAVDHPSYLGTYPPLPNRERARHRLGLGEDDLWVAFIGQVREYKKLDLLLDALEQARSVRLIVAGSTGAGARASAQSDRAARSQRVHRIDRHLSDEELVDVVAAANAVVLPYDGALNSGVLALALTHGRATIVADVPQLRAIADEETTSFFDPGDSVSLATALSGPHEDGLPSSRGVGTPDQFAAIISDLVG